MHDCEPKAQGQPVLHPGSEATLTIACSSVPFLLPQSYRGDDASLSECDDGNADQQFRIDGGYISQNKAIDADSCLITDNRYAAAIHSRPGCVDVFGINLTPLSLCAAERG